MLTQTNQRIVAVLLALAAAPAWAATNLQILVNTGPTAVNEPGVTWNNITSASANVPLKYSDGSLSGLTYANLTGVAVVNDTRYTPAADLASHPLPWISSLSAANRDAFATNFAQNAFNPPSPTNLNMTGFSGLTGRNISVDVVATYSGTTVAENRLGDYLVNNEFTTFNSGPAKPSDDFSDGSANLNYMHWDNLPWGAGSFAGDAMTVSFLRSNNTTVLNGYAISYALPGIVADFAGGAGATSADQFGGKAGDGWLGGWNKSGTTVTATVETSNPLNGGGNYLAVTDVDATGGGYTRQFSDFADISTTLGKYTVEADFRIDSASHNDFQLGIRQSNGVNTGPDVLANIKAVSDFWRTTNGNGLGGSNDQNTGIAVVTGHVYHVEFQIDPTTLTYILTLDDLDDAAAPYVSGVFNTRNTSVVANPYLFVGRQFSNVSGGAFSIDSVLISVPTPAALPAGLALWSALAWRRRK
ncbi:MAG: hypothetical protein GC162_00230 [Planctomycetes bacterium]|nr:hypothetical protein [Planctomycetota bacterium]